MVGFSQKMVGFSPNVLIWEMNNSTRVADGHTAIKEMTEKWKLIIHSWFFAEKWISNRQKRPMWMLSTNDIRFPKIWYVPLDIKPQISRYQISTQIPA